jgi:hypothetical protein
VTLSPQKASGELGRAVGVGAGPVVALWRGALRWSIVVAFVFRGALSLAEALSMPTGAFQPLVPISSGSLSSYSSIWPLTWGVLSLATAGALALRIRIGWLVGVAVTIAYLVMGISSASAQANVLKTDAVSALAVIGIGLVVPLVILGGLISIKVWYLPSSRPLSRLGRARLERRTPPTLDRWRRRN